MIEKAEFENCWQWKQRRNGYFAWIDDRDFIIRPLSWAIYPKKNDQFYCEAYRPAGAKARLPFIDFATVEEAQQWAMDYEYRRQADAEKRQSEAIVF